MKVYNKQIIFRIEHKISHSIKNTQDPEEMKILKKLKDKSTGKFIHLQENLVKEKY